MPTWEAVPPCSSPDVDALLGCAPTAADMKTALEHDPTNRAVARHVETLQKAVDERNEKLKNEMLGRFTAVVL